MKARWRKVIFIAASAVFSAALICFVVSRLSEKSIVEQYIEAERKAFRETAESIEKHYISLINKQKPFLESINSSRTELTADITGGAESFGFDDTGAISGILKKSKLIIETKRHPEKGISATEADLLIERAPFLNARLFTDRRSVWLSVPDILPDRYVSVKRDDLDKLYDRFRIPVRPVKLISGSEIAGSLSFDLASLMESAEKLSDIYTGYLTEETVTDNGSVTIPADGLQTEGREILITLDEEKASSLLKELLTAISDDDALLQYTYGNFANLSELMDGAGLFGLFDYLDDSGLMTLSDYEREILGKLNVKKDIAGFKDKLKTAAASYRLRDGLRMRVMLDKSGDILYREVRLDFRNSAEGGSFRTDIRAGGGPVQDDGSYTLAGITVEEYGTDGAGMTTELLITSSRKGAEGKDTEENIGIMYAVTPAGGVRSETNIDIDISGRTDEKTMKRLKNIKLMATVDGDTGKGSINAVIDNAVWENKKLNKSNSSTDIKVEADLPFLGINGFAASLSIAREDSFGIDDFSLPDFESALVTDIYAASDEDLKKLETEIMASFGTFYLNNKYIFDALLGWG